MKDPIAVFNSLGYGPRFRDGLWEPQVEVLKAYYSIGDKSRVAAFELPTGAGKTVIGLIIAEAYRSEGLSVAYLCDTNALAERILHDAQDLDIPAVFVKGKGVSDDLSKREHDLDAYHYANALGIFSFAGFLRGSGVSPPDVLVVDDAHAFESQLLDSFSLTVDRRNSELYNSLLYLLSKQPHQNHLLEIFGLSGEVDQDYVELIPFTLVEQLSGQIQDILSAGVANDDNIRWALPRLKGHLSEWLVIVSRDAIAFRPYLASVWDLTVGFDGDKTLGECLQRLVLMSATLGSTETIKERFGISENIYLIDRVSVKTQLETMGQRIVIPLVSTGATSMISSDTTRLITEIVKDAKKALVLSNSFRDTKDIRGALIEEHIPYVEYFTDNDLDSFRRMSNGALISTNRFIGLDLSGKNCPVGIQVRIPYVIDPLDGLKKRIVRDSAYADEKVVQRLVQSFGRLNRGPNDRAVYFILDERFSGERRRSDFFDHFPPELRAQILFGWMEGGNNMTYQGKRSLVHKYLSGQMSECYEIGISKYTRITIKDVRPKQRFKAEYVDMMVDAWRFVIQGKLSDASLLFEKIAKGRESTEPFMAAWHYYMASHAHYIANRHQGSPLNTMLLKGWLERAYSLGETGWFSRIPGIINYIEGGKDSGPAISSPNALEVKRRVADNWKDFRKSCPEDNEGEPGSGPMSKWRRLTAAVREGSHGEVLHEMEQLLRLLGYDRVIRERQEGENIDILAYSAVETPRHVIVIEVKTRKDRKSESQVHSNEIDQVVADAKAQEAVGSIYEKVAPVIFTNREKVHEEAVLNATKTKVRIITADVMEEFLRHYFAAMERFWRFADAKQEETIVASLPSPSTLLPLFEFDGRVQLMPGDVASILQL